MDYQIGPVLYSAALHEGLDPKEFHRRCDGKGATLLVIQDENGCVWMCVCVCVCVCVCPLDRVRLIVAQG